MNAFSEAQRAVRKVPEFKKDLSFAALLARTRVSARDQDLSRG
jgi:hypothetical protein